MLDFILHMNGPQIFGLFTVGTGVVFILSAIAARMDFSQHGDTLGAAALLALLLELAYLVRTGTPGPMGIGETVWMAVFDLGGLLVASYWFLTRRSVWKFLLTFTFAASLVAHYAAYRGWYAGQDTRYTYILSLNLLGALQLIAVGFPGARHVASVLSARMHDAGLTRVRVRHGSPR